VDTTAPKRPSKAARRAQIALWAYFVFGGGAYAFWAVHIPEYEARFGLSHGQMSWIMLLFGVGAFGAMQVVGPLIDRVGSRTFTWLGGALLGLAMASLGLSNNPVWLAASVLAVGFFMGSMDVSMNAHSVEVENLFGRPIFTLFHAFWSIGGLACAYLGSVTLAAGWHAPQTLALYGAIVAVASLALSGWLLPNNPSHQASDKHEAREHAAENRRFLPYVYLLGSLATAAAIGEGASIDWSPLHLKTVLGASESVAAYGVFAVSLTMSVMRLIGDRIVERFDRITVIRWGAGISGVGYLVAIFSNNVPQSLIGWAIAGIGVSAVIPQFFALAGNIGNPTHQGRNMAKVVGMVYVGLMIGPAIIGALTAFVSLQYALLTGAILFGIVVAGMPFAVRLQSKILEKD
jgi:MFS family permease